MFKRESVLAFTLLLCAGVLFAQDPVWEMRTADFRRLKNGQSKLIVDKMRHGVMFDGGAYDTYITYDNGSTWEFIFDLKMFYIDATTRWKIDEVGRWYFIGDVYNQYPINLVSEDAGKTIRYLIVDTTQLPHAYRNEERPLLHQPNAILLPGDRVPEQDGRFYYSCDAGMTWQSSPKQTTLGMSNIRLTSVAPGVLGAKSDDSVALELSFCDTSWVRTNIPMNMQYFRLLDGTVVQFKSGGPISSVIRVRKPGEDTFSIFPDYYDPYLDSTYKIGLKYATLLNDTTVMFVYSLGAAAVYTSSGGLEFIHKPQYLNKYQQIVNAGRFGDLLLLQWVQPNSTAAGSCRWTTYNSRTGVVRTYDRLNTNPVEGLLWNSEPPFQEESVIPFSGSTWIASLRQGELIQTTNAGMTWVPVDNIDRDEQWGESFLGVNALFPRGDGSMALLNEHGRLMVRKSHESNWSIALMAPVVHEIEVDGVSSLTGTSTVYYRGDFGYRLRFGQPSLFFHSKDTIWTSGDVLCRFTSDGEYIDTLLKLKTHFIKRLSNTVIVAGMDSVYVSYNDGKEWYYVNQDWPTTAHGPGDTARATLGDMVLAQDGSLVAGLRGYGTTDSLHERVDSVPGGLLRSTDNGNTWKKVTLGIKNNLYITSLIRLETGTLLCIGSNLWATPGHYNFTTGEWERTESKKLKMSEFLLSSAVVYRSTDNGVTWRDHFTFPPRDDLGETDPKLMIMPDGRIIAIQPQAGVAISADDGVHWGVGDPLNIGDPEINDVVFTQDGWVHLATNEGYVRLRIENLLSVEEHRSAIGSLNVHITQSGMLQLHSDIVAPYVRIHTLDGQLVLACSNANGLNEIQLPSVSAGTYVVIASSPKEVRTALIQLQ